MTTWRRALPAPQSQSALPQDVWSDEPEAPWVPDDVVGPATVAPPPSPPDTGAARAWLGTPPAAGPMPVVVSEWELAHEGDGTAKARPRLLAVPRATVTVKDDDAAGRERVRRFVEAWRWLIAARSQVQSVGLSADESDRYLAGAGVLVRIVPPASHRRARATRPQPAPPPDRAAP